MEKITPNLDMARSFLDVLYGGFPGEQIEFRLLKGKKGQFKPIVRIADLPVENDTLLGLDRANRDGFNVYFGVATRRDMKPMYIPAVWVDIDFKDLKSRLISLTSLITIKLRSGNMRPSLIVESGHGVHVYWRTTAGPEDHSRVQDINRKLAKLYGGDAVSDVARILRLPGFYNTKDMENPQFCQVSSSTDWGIIRMWELSELEEALNNVPLPILNEKLERLIIHGNQGEYKSRSEADFAVIAGMLRRGFSEEEIREAFHSGKIGDKAREKGIYEEEYISRTIEAAQMRTKQ